MMTNVLGAVKHSKRQSVQKVSGTQQSHHRTQSPTGCRLQKQRDLKPFQNKNPTHTNAGTFFELRNVICSVSAIGFQQRKDKAMLLARKPRIQLLFGKHETTASDLDKNSDLQLVEDDSPSFNFLLCVLNVRKRHSCKEKMNTPQGTSFLSHQF